MMMMFFVLFWRFEDRRRKDTLAPAVGGDRFPHPRPPSLCRWLNLLQHGV